MPSKRIALRVGAVVVTYNRRALLTQCLSAIANQTVTPELLLIVDNASTDDTRDWLTGWLSENRRLAQPLALKENLGGAGGFAEGLRNAIEQKMDWVWLMDDDAEPHPEALEELLKVADDSANVYASLAVNGDATSWTTTLLGPPVRVVDVAADVPERSEVGSLPFLGFLIHRDLVARIGLPDAGYFIAADDVEYCVRASRSGSHLIIAGKSHIEHPRTRRQMMRVLGHDVVYLRLPPWKRYYDTRNRLLIARKYHGVKLLTQTLPGSFMRLFAALVHEPRKLAQSWAWCCGMFDGLLGIKGKRHQKWGIRQ
ncbi:MAG: glycosyltransferase family 2 protein [Rhodanobacteraceae bacterium]